MYENKWTQSGMSSAPAKGVGILFLLVCGSLGLLGNAGAEACPDLNGRWICNSSQLGIRAMKIHQGLAGENPVFEVSTYDFNEAAKAQDNPDVSDETVEKNYEAQFVADGKLNTNPFMPREFYVAKCVTTAEPGSSTKMTQGLEIKSSVPTMGNGMVTVLTMSGEILNAKAIEFMKDGDKVLAETDVSFSCTKAK